MTADHNERDADGGRNGAGLGNANANGHGHDSPARAQPVKDAAGSSSQPQSGTPASANQLASSLESSPSHHYQHRTSTTQPEAGGGVDAPRSTRKPYRHRNHRRARSPSPISGSDHWPYGSRPRDHSHYHHHHHRFPLAASSSVADLNSLADLIDNRSGWCEDRRVDDDKLEFLCKGKSRSVKAELKEYYEELNYILDGWRLADIVVESQFPAEVMRRFGTVEEAEEAMGRSAQLQYHHHHPLDGTMSPRLARFEDRKYSLHSKTAQALGLGGFWFTPGHDSDDHKGSGAGTPVKSRLPSEEESGFDSDSEPEPNQVGPGPRRAHRGTNGASAFTEAQPLLGKKKKKSVRDSQRGRRTTETSYGTNNQSLTGPGGGGSSSSNKGNAANSADSAQNKAASQLVAVVRDVTPAGRDPASLESASSAVPAMAQAGSSADGNTNKSRSNSGSANEEEGRDQLTALPGGKRERERLALRSAVPGWEEAEKGEERAVQFAININLIINVLLLAGKAIAVLSSSSVSLLASLVDSALDLLSTLIIFAASKAVAFKSSESYFKYPRGKKNFEPLGVVIFSVLMIASFCQVLVESVERLSQVMKGVKDSEGSNELPLIGVAFMVATIGIKAVMWVLYRKSKSSGVRAVAQDSQNDVVFNVFSLTFPFFGARLGWPALDPIGGIVLSLYIISEWLSTLIATTTKLSGARASSSDLARVLYLITRFKSVKSISACEMYYAGDETVVEADVVLPVGMPLKEVHDTMEILAYCLETMPSVGRAYIHPDYNSLGQPAHISDRG